TYYCVHALKPTINCAGRRLVSRHRMIIDLVPAQARQAEYTPARVSVGKSTIKELLGMKITVQSSRAVRPDYGSGGGAGGGADVVPLSVFDKVNFDTYVSVIYVFRPPMPPNAALE